MNPTCPACRASLPDDSEGMTRCPSCLWLCRVHKGVAESWVNVFCERPKRRKPGRRRDVTLELPQ